MRKTHFENLARLVVLLCAAAALVPTTALGGGHRHRGCVDAPADAVSATTGVYPFAGDFPYSPGEPWCYAVPVQAVYQFPAVIANQPGSQVGYLQTSPASGLLGGRPYLYHP
jgi:hypothetical protein